MNYLAHLFLADESAPSLVGNLLGDFVKGVLTDQFDEEIRRGIAHHRTIDVFCDAHPLTVSSRRLFSLGRRRFAGIIVDVCYDHFLCNHWTEYTRVPLHRFIEHAYAALLAHGPILPERLRRILPAMIAENWLASYRHLGGVETALDRLARRLKRGEPLTGSIEEVKIQYERLEANFCAFFPALMDYSQACKREASRACETLEASGWPRAPVIN